MSKFTVTEYAHKIGVTRGTIHYRIKHNKIKYRKINGKFFIIEENETKVSDDKKINLELKNKIKILELEQVKNKELLESKDETIQALKFNNLSLIKNYEQLEKSQLLLEENQTKSFWKFWKN